MNTPLTSVRYGPSTHAQMAPIIMYLRHPPESRPEFARMIVLTADRYLRFDPERFPPGDAEERARHCLRGTIAEIIFCLDTPGGSRAAKNSRPRALLCGLLTAHFFFREGNPLPMAMALPGRPYPSYAAGGGSTTLMLRFGSGLVLDSKEDRPR